MKNMNVTPEADTKASKKPSKMKVVFAAVVAVVLVLVGVYYFVFNQPAEGPPTLGAADQSLYQGLIQTGQYGFIQFDADDIADWVEPTGENSLSFEYANSKEGLHYVASSTGTTLEQILLSMNPSETPGELMIAVYDDGFFMSLNYFYVAGEGVPLTIVPEEDLDTVIIEPNRFFILASDKDIELWGSDFYTMDTSPENFDFCAQTTTGWFPGAFSGDIANEFAVTESGITVDCLPDELWALDPVTLEFVEQDLTSLTTLNTFIWVEYETVSPADAVAAAIAAELAAAATDTTAPAPITDLTHSDATATSITLSWTASGDDDMTGTATSYDVRYSTSPIIEGNWDSATETEVTGEQTIPSPAGSVENMTVSGLLAETTYYFAIKVSDEAENESDISAFYKVATIEEPVVAECNIATDDLCDEGTGTCIENSIPNTGTDRCECEPGYDITTTITGTACEIEGPETTVLVAPIADLTVFSETLTSITLSWTAPEDEELYEPHYSYDVRFSSNEITEGEEWEDAIQIIGDVPYPEQLPGGDIQMLITVNELSPGTSYYFAVKVLDEDKNESDISNVHSASTTQ